MTNFALDPDSTFETFIWKHVHFGIWGVRDQTLVMGVNLDSQSQAIPLAELPRWEEDVEPEVLYAISASFTGDNLTLEGLGVVTFVMRA